jgi:hypothetical protein
MGKWVMSPLVESESNPLEQSGIFKVDMPVFGHVTLLSIEGKSVVKNVKYM